MKTALEILYKYTPDSTARAILEKAQNPMVRADKENRALQMELDFPRLVEKDELYRIEEQVAEAYGLNYVKFLPHYPAELFSADYVPELLKETERVGVVARGFFGKYRYELKEDTPIIRIPFSEAAIRLIRDARTPEIMSRIIRSEFGLDVTVIIENSEEMQEQQYSPDQIARLEADNEVERFILGFEESYGYLAGPYVRDKDAVVGSMLICEMAAYYRSIGSSIKERLEAIYAKYGRYLNKVDSFEFPGLSGMDKMAGIMASLRENAPAEIGGYKVVKAVDYKDTAATATETTATAIGEALAVHVVRGEYQCILRHIIEIVCHVPEEVTLFSTITSIGIGEETVSDTFLHFKVEYGLLFAVIDSSKKSLIGLLLYNLDLLDHLGRDILRSQLRIVKEEGLSIDGDL